MIQDDALTSHLPRAALERLLATSDMVLVAGGARWVCHRALLALESEPLATLVSLAEASARSPRSSDTLLVVELPPSVPEAILELSNDSWRAFLGGMYRSAAWEWDTLPGALALADFFSAANVVQRADEWLCSASRGSDQSIRASAFELAARHRLGGTMAALLPWAVQCMARGSRCAAVWWDGKQRSCRLKAAFDDSQLKCLVLDAYWWSREAQEPCAKCSCNPADVSSSWDTRLDWAAPAHPGQGITSGQWLHPAAYTRAVHHYAHLLSEAEWACTPVAAATSLFPLPAPALA